MPTIFESEDRKVKRFSNDQSRYKVYNEDDSRIAKLEFGTNGLTDEILLSVLSDRFKEQKSKKDTPINKHLLDCIESALLGMQLNKIKKVAKPMLNHGYAELQVDLNSGEKLYRAIIPEVPEGTDLIPVNKLHATLMYDKTNPDIIPRSNNTIYKGKIVGVEMLGNVGSQWRAVVLLLESETVQNRFKELTKQGFKHSYDDLKLHVSLSYGQDSEVIYPIIEKLFEEGKLPETVTLCNETWDQIKD